MLELGLLQRKLFRRISMWLFYTLTHLLFFFLILYSIFVYASVYDSNQKTHNSIWENAVDYLKPWGVLLKDIKSFWGVTLQSKITLSFIFFCTHKIEHTLNRPQYKPFNAISSRTAQNSFQPSLFFLSVFIVFLYILRLKNFTAQFYSSSRQIQFSTLYVSLNFFITHIFK